MSTPLSPEQIVRLKAKLDEYSLERAAEEYGPLNMWVDSTLSPSGDYNATVHVVAKGYAKEITCEITFT